MKSLQIQLSTWLISLVSLVVVVLSLILISEFRQDSDKLEKISTDALKNALLTQAHKHLRATSFSLRENLINPLYQLNMLQIQTLLKTELAQKQIISAEVFDTKGMLIHDGSELLKNYGKNLLPLKHLTRIESGAYLSQQQEQTLSAFTPVNIANENLGILKLTMDLGILFTEQNLLAKAISKNKQETLNNNVILSILIIICMIILASIASYYLSRKLSQPIETLANHAKDIGIKNNRSPIKVTRSDEIGQLQLAFNRMIIDLNSNTVSHSYLKNIVNSMHESLFLLDQNLAVKLCNQSARRQIGVAENQLLDQPFLPLIAQAKQPHVEQWLKNSAAGNHEPLETTLVAANNENLSVELSATPLFDPAQGQMIVCVAQDISQRKRAENKIRFLAQYDSLTRLPNRVLFNDRLKHAMVQADRNDCLIALFLLDIDYFKKVNDSLGHTAGDELLIQIARRLRSIVRQGDTVARLGGDEFGINLEFIKNTAEAEAIATKIIAQMRKPFKIGNQTFHTSASLGISYYPFSDITAETLIRQAEIAMNTAKTDGRSHYQTYSENFTSTSFQQDQLELENDLHHAIENKQIHLYYQPQILSSTGRIIAAEALLRWHHPSRGTIPCSILIPMLEELGLMENVNLWIFDTAFKEAAKWQHHGDIGISINLTTDQFCHPQLLSHITKALKHSDLKPELLEIEITESSLITDIERSRKHIQQLSAQGISVAIDDFGTGYSSLSYLRQFELQTLKIDQSFVEGLPDDKNAFAICQVIIALAEALKLRVIAEGAETEKQMKTLTELGANIIQGFYSGKPQTAEDFTHNLRLQNKQSLANF